VTQYNVVEGFRRFGGSYAYFDSEDEDHTFLQNDVKFLPGYVAILPRKYILNLLPFEPAFVTLSTIRSPSLDIREPVEV
jgi:hypothetical protein